MVIYFGLKIVYSLSKIIQHESCYITYSSYISQVSLTLPLKKKIDIIPVLLSPRTFQNKLFEQFNLFLFLMSTPIFQLIHSLVLVKCMLHEKSGIKK